MTTDPQTDRIPVAHSIVYAVRGVPEIADEYSEKRAIAPTEITLTYRSAPDSQLGRVHAYVKGWWMEDGARVPMDKPVGRHFYGGPEAWPVWLAEEARLHDPASVPSAPVDRAAVLAEAATRYEEILANANTGQDPRYWTAVRDITLGLRRMADEEQPEAWDVPDARPGTTDHTLVQRRADEEGLSGPCDCGEGAVHYTNADCPAALRRESAEAEERHTRLHAESGEDTEGCDCGHEGMGLRRHGEACAWVKQLTEEARQLLADEEPQPETEAHPAEHTWAAELYDPVADEWVPGTRYITRDRAVNHLAHARTVGPTWRDGTPTQRRLVRATTTYTVEAEPTVGPRCGNNPNYRLSDGDQQVVDEFKAYLQRRAAGGPPERDPFGGAS